MELRTLTLKQKQQLLLEVLVGLCHTFLKDRQTSIKLRPCDIAMEMESTEVNFTRFSVASPESSHRLNSPVQRGAKDHVAVVCPGLGPLGQHAGDRHA